MCVRKLKQTDITCPTTKFSKPAGGGYGPEAWSPLIKLRALSGAQGCVLVTQKAPRYLPRHSGTTEGTKTVSFDLECIATLLDGKGDTQLERTKTKLTKTVHSGPVSVIQTRHTEWGRRVRHNGWTSEQQPHPKATLP